MAAICNNKITAGFIEIPTQIKLDNKNISLETNFTQVKQPQSKEFVYKYMLAKYGNKKNEYRNDLRMAREAISYYAYNLFLKFIKTEYHNFATLFVSEKFERIYNYLQRHKGVCNLTAKIGFTITNSQSLEVYTYTYQDDTAGSVLGEQFNRELADFIAINFPKTLKEATKIDTNSLPHYVSLVSNSVYPFLANTN